MSKQGRNRKPLIVGIVAAVVILAVLLVLLLTQCAPGGGSSPTDTGTGKPQTVENADLYWNMDRMQYDGKSEGGMSSRNKESDGYFHFRFFKDGKVVELRAEDKVLVNKIDAQYIMGLVIDEDGIITDMIPIEQMPVEKVGWKFYVQSTGGKVIKVNSSNKFNGVELVLELDGDTKVYDMTGTFGAIGMETEAVLNDRVMAVADLEGNLLAVYIYDRSNMVIEFEAECQHCEETVTWIEWDDAKTLPKEGGHYQLVTDIQLNAQQSIKGDAKICLDLNGHTVDGKEGTRVYSLHNQNCELAIMDTSEEQTGRLAGHGEIYAQGAVLWVRYGAAYLYGGTLDASDVVCTGRGGAAVYVPKERFFYMHGGQIIGGTAKYYFNEETGKYANGLGGSVYVLGKFVLNDGEIRDGIAQSVPVYSGGKTAYQRGIGGNVYVGSGGEFEMNGGVIKNGKAGSAGNIYLDGTAEFTMNNGTISGGAATDPGRQGGNLNIGAKATFILNNGTISGGSSRGNSGNIYLSGTLNMYGGTVTGGRVLDSKTGAAKAGHASANMYIANGARLEMYGGTVSGSVSAIDSSTTDGKHTRLVLSSYAVIYGAPEGTPNLTLYTGKEPVQVVVGTMQNRAKVGITASGKFTLETKQSNQDNFISDIEGAEVLYVDNCLALGKLACLCGSKTDSHIGDCSGEALLWSPWTSNNSLPNTDGSYYLINDVSYTSSKNFGSSKAGVNVNLDLNGKTVESAQRVSTVFGALNLADHVGGGQMIGAGQNTGKDHTGAILVYTDSKLNIYGGTIRLADKHNNISTGGVMGIGAGAVVNLYSGCIDGRSVDATGKDSDTTGTVGNGGAVRLSGTLNVAGGTVYGGSANRGGAIYLEKTGVLNISKGTVYGGSAGENGGAVYVAGGTVNLSGGAISGGSAVEGGAVRIQADGVFNMTGGVIENGTSTGNGGNVSLRTGTFNLKGGEVKGGTTGASGGNFSVSTTLNMSGGTVSGGKTTADKSYGGNIHMDRNTAVVNLSGGTVTGGCTPYRGGNLSGIGTLNMTGGTVTAGNAGNGGGNIEGSISNTMTVNISGGTITGGLYKDAADTDRGNIYMTSGTLNISGNAVIVGGILLVNKPVCTVSGNPQILGKTVSIKLSGVNAPAPTLTVGELEDTARIGITYEGVFGVEAEAADAANFVSDTEGLTVHYEASDNTLFMGHAHCLCEDGTADWCDHKVVRWTKWDGKTDLVEGSYYLAADTVTNRAVKLGEEGKSLNICLGGKTLTGSDKADRIMNVYGTVSVFDHAEAVGALAGVGTGKAHSAVAVVQKGGVLNLYSGTMKLSENYSAQSNNGGTVSVAAGGVMNIYGGCVDASASLTSETEIVAGAALRVAGELNVYGGTVVGGKVTGNGGAILIKSTGAVNVAGGEITGGQAASGGAIYMEGGELTVSGGNVNGGTVSQAGSIYQAAGTVTMTSGTITGGRATGNAHGGGIYVASGATFRLQGGTVKEGVCVNKNGGNFAVNGTLEISGDAKVLDGSAKAATSNNIYVQNGTLKVSGNAYINGGVNVISSNSTGAKVELSGPVTIADSETGAYLNLGRTGSNPVPVIQITGALTEGDKKANVIVKLGNTTRGLFAEAAGEYVLDDADKTCFTAQDTRLTATYDVVAQNMVLADYRCLCKTGDKTWCDHTKEAWLPWDGAAELGDGQNYYLTSTVNDAAAVTVDGKNVKLDLNGYAFNATKRAFQIRNGATMSIVDSSYSTGAVTGKGNASGQNGGVLHVLSATLNIYGGTFTLAEGHLEIGSGGVMTAGGDNVFVNIYGGTVGSESASGSVKDGGAINISNGELKILGGTVKALSSITGVGKGVCAASSSSVTVGGDANVENLYLPDGKKITVDSGIDTANANVVVEMANPGIFAEGVATDLSGAFDSAVSGHEVGYDAAAQTLRLYVSHRHCWCENAESVQADHVHVNDQEWEPVTGTTTAETGYYYLNWTGNKAASFTVKKDQTAYLCLNGAGIRATSCIKLEENATLYICDCVGGGEISTTGQSPIQLTDGKTVYLYSGTVNGTYKTTASRVSVLMNGGTFHMYGGKITGGCSKVDDVTDANKKETADKGGNVYMTDGAFYMHGGEISGGVFEGSMRDVTVAGGTFAIDGKVTVGNVYLADGKKVTVGSLTAGSSVGISMEKAGVFAEAAEGKTLSYEDKAHFTSVDTKYQVAFAGNGLELVDAAIPATCACAATDGNHADWCNQLDPIAWVDDNGDAITDRLPTEGTYYLTAPVEVSAVTQVTGKLNLWLQGNDITISDAYVPDETLKNEYVFYVDDAGSLALLDTAEEAGTIHASENTFEIIRSAGTLVVDGVNLDASAITAGTAQGLAVYVGEADYPNSLFLLKDGTITGGTTTGWGGAVYVVGGSTMKMSGGTITGGTALCGGNIGTRGTVEITGGSVTNGRYTGSGSRGGNICAGTADNPYNYIASVAVSGDVEIKGGYTNATTKALTDRANICCWGANLSLTDVELEGGVYMAGTGYTATLSGVVKIAGGDKLAMSVTTTVKNQPIATIKADALAAGSSVNIVVHSWANAVDNVYVTGLAKALAEDTENPVFTCVTSGYSLNPVLEENGETYKLVLAN